MKKNLLLLTMILSGIMLTIGSCDKDGNFTPNLFPESEDVALGLQMSNEISNNPDDFPILDKSTNQIAYQHIERIRDSIINTGLLQHEADYGWEVKIIHNDEVLNAFATPGGYLYFYTGLIKFLDNEAQFAGVMAHEIAHSDRRHSTEQLTKAYGASFLLSLLLGEDPSELAEIAAGLAQGLSTLAFSRDDEYEADEYSVKYLYQTAYDARGIAEFFNKMEDSPRPPEFLSTHPSPENRIERINTEWETLGGKEGLYFADRYASFKNSLPN